MTRWIAAAVLVLVLAGNSRASFYDGNSLLALCEQNESACRAYAAGLIDLLYFQDAGSKNRACVDEGVKISQISDIVKRYLTQFPENVTMKQRPLYSLPFMRSSLASSQDCVLVCVTWQGWPPKKSGKILAPAWDG